MNTIDNEEVSMIASTQKVIFEDAQRCLENEAYEIAVTRFLELVNLPSCTGEAQFGLGDSYFGLGEYEKAEEAYRAGLAIIPNNADGLFGLGATLRVSELFEEAVSCYERGFGIEPERYGAYWELAYAREMSGDKIGAEADYRECLKHYPNHGMAKHLLSAMLGQTTDRAPNEYVRDLFDDYADTFEQDLIEDLDYIVPQLIRNELELLIKPGENEKGSGFSKVLDLGCGTGLVSTAIKDLVTWIDGVDLSEKMLALARKKERYDNVFLREITSFLSDRNSGQPIYDLILSGDALVYFGDLKNVFKGVKQRLCKGGHFCFTLENLNKESFKICPTGRYAHSESYIRQLSLEYGFSLIVTKSIVPRTDASSEIEGRLYLLHFPHPD